LVSFGFLWFGVWWILGFPLVSFVFFWFCFVSKGKPKEKKTQGKHKPIKENLRRL
jgi:hypothetical protein